MFKDKGLVIGIIITVILIGAGVFYFSKTDSSSSISTSSAPISQDILISKEANKTSGLVNGSYLPATDSAKLTLVEFGDYECPACGVYHPLTKKLLEDFAGKMNFVFRNFPLSQHANAQISAEAAEAAGLQGKFWQMHDKLYETQSEWSSAANAIDIFLGYAQSLGLNMDQFKKDIDSKEIKDKIAADLNDGTLTKLNATPTYYINGVKVDNMPPNYDELKAMIASKLSQ